MYPLTGRACRRLPRVGLRRGHGGDLLRAAGTGVVGHGLMLGIPLAHRSVLGYLFAEQGSRIQQLVAAR